jgi:hypothetical protein
LNFDFALEALGIALGNIKNQDNGKNNANYPKRFHQNSR